MIRIDDTLLEEIGLISLPKAERDQMLRQIYETLEMRVGMKLAERMTDQQLDEFERFIDTNDEAGALKWLETNFPDYKQVVADELEKLKVEIKKDSAKIIETMQGQAQPVGGGVVPQQQYVQQPPAANVPSPAYTPQQPGAVATPIQSAPPAQLDYDQPVQPIAVSAPVVQQPVAPVFTSPAPQQPVAEPGDFTQTQQPVSPQSDDQTDNTTAPTGSGSIPPPPSF